MALAKSLRWLLTEALAFQDAEPRTSVWNRSIKDSRRFEPVDSRPRSSFS